MIERNVLHHGDCLAVLPTLEADSFDACTTDPPYGLEFRGKEWDAPWASGFTMSPTGRYPDPLARTRRNPTCAVCGHSARGKDACQCAAPQFDTTSVAKAMRARAHGQQTWHEEWAREVYRVLKPGAHLLAFGGTRTYHRLVCAVEDAGFEIRDSIAWLYGSGFPKSLDVSKAIDKAAGAEREATGTARGAGSQRTAALGPYAPEYDATVPATDAARSWQGWGTALKPAMELIVVARKPLSESSVAANVLRHGTGAINVDGCRVAGDVPQVTQGVNANGSSYRIATESQQSHPHDAGRWPANVLLDPEAARLLDEQSGERPSGARAGGASRFFYTAKADAAERSAGMATRSTHPTVKPVSLMAWLIRLVTPPGGLVCDPFLGSGTTAVAAIGQGVDWVGIEREDEYVQIALQRIGLGARMAS